MTKIKPEFVRRYAVACQSWASATNDEKERKVIEKPVAVKMRAELGKQFWILESKDFRTEIAESAVAAHAEEMKEWEALKQTPTTPLEFHQYVNLLQTALNRLNAISSGNWHMRQHIFVQ